MANQGKTTSQFPVQTYPYNANDRVVFVYGADTIGNTTSVAQTATITIGNLFGTSSSNLSVSIVPQDPANSTSLQVNQGTIFVTSSYLYVATQNNFVQRIALSTF